MKQSVSLITLGVADYGRARAFYETLGWSVAFEAQKMAFFRANGIVLVPVFNDANDRIALNTLAALFSTREIVPIYSGDLVWGLGTMHCMTQQQPSALSKKA